MNTQQIEIQIHDQISSVGQCDWDACACPDQDSERPTDPFTTYRFLSALEQSGSVGAGTGWSPRHISASLDGTIIAVAPMYAKGHSQGEYVFDHNWADAYERAGGKYYPKLQIAVPFTPATGKRFLTRSGFDAVGRSALVQGGVQLAAENELSSLHVSFCTADEADIGSKVGLLHRTGQQFHWQNDGYTSFDSFLERLSSRKRKNISKERRSAADFGGRIHCLTGSQIEAEHWNAFWRFYQDTGARKWGSPYLTRPFFEIAHDTLRDDILLIMAQRDGDWVAGALNFIGSETLFGRYWGCSENHHSLHFELCYYQAIEYAIRNNMTRVEAGAQGEHKLARGYLPVVTHSLHWIADAGFRDAVDQYLLAERNAVDDDIEILTSYGPFKKKKERTTNDS